MSEFPWSPDDARIAARENEYRERSERIERELRLLALDCDCDICRFNGNGTQLRPNCP